MGAWLDLRTCVCMGVRACVRACARACVSIGLRGRHIAFTDIYCMSSTAVRYNRQI